MLYCSGSILVQWMHLESESKKGLWFSEFPQNMSFLFPESPRTVGEFFVPFLFKGKARKCYHVGILNGEKKVLFLNISSSRSKVIHEKLVSPKIISGTDPPTLFPRSFWGKKSVIQQFYYFYSQLKIYDKIFIINVFLFLKASGCAMDFGLEYGSHSAWERHINIRQETSSFLILKVT